MKAVFILFAAGGMILYAGSSGICDNLEDARRRADDAYDYSGRAVNSNNVRDANYFSRQAMSATEDARDSAVSGRASDAAGYAAKAYDYSERAYRTQNIKDAHYYSRLAEKSAGDAQESIDSSIAKNRAARAAKNAEATARISSELAKKRAEAAIADMQSRVDNETVTDNRTVESKILEKFGR